MESTYHITLLLIIFGVVGIGGFSLLQVVLSRQPSKYPGLILPLLAEIFVLFTVIGKVSYVTDGPGASFWCVLSGAFVTFLIMSVPAIIFLVIYFVCRNSKKQKRDKEMRRINIRDLE